MTLMGRLRIYKYQFRHWFFRWVRDEDGDVGLQIARIVTLVKYKEHTLIKWFGKYERAEKYQGYQPRQAA